MRNAHDGLKHSLAIFDKAHSKVLLFVLFFIGLLICC